LLCHRGETRVAQFHQQLPRRDGGVATRRLGQEELAEYVRNSRTQTKEKAPAPGHGAAQTREGHQQEDERAGDREEAVRGPHQREGRLGKDGRGEGGGGREEAEEVERSACPDKDSFRRSHQRSDNCSNIFDGHCFQKKLHHFTFTHALCSYW
jgi:hypothetical protein